MKAAKMANIAKTTKDSQDSQAAMTQHNQATPMEMLAGLVALAVFTARPCGRTGPSASASPAGNSNRVVVLVAGASGFDIGVDGVTDAEADGVGDLLYSFMCGELVLRINWQSGRPDEVP